MKKHNLAQFFKSKSFYTLLCVGAFAILIIAMVGFYQSSDKDNNQNLVDLNEQSSDVAEKDNNQDLASDTNNTTSSDVANNEAGNKQTEVAQGNQDTESNKAVTDGSLLEFDADNSEENVADNEDTTEAKSKESKEDTASDSGKTTKPKQTASAAQTTDNSKPVMSTENLHFKAEDGLSWPVKGSVLMDYSADRVVYFKTLEEFRCNPALIIGTEVGTDVKCAAKGIITSITTEDETGVTVTESLGNGYSLVYGQLQEDVTVEVGDTVEAGTVLGKVADPTKYYSVEGSNLYFQVIKDKDTVDPMDLLKK